MKWAAPLTDLPGYFRQQNPSVLVKQSIDAVYQVYGYMTFNDNKYGVLSNMDYAWFFQRVERGQTMQYYGPIGVDPASSPSMLKAFVGIILLAEHGWFHSSPTPASPPLGQYFGTSHTAVCQRNVAIRHAQNYHLQVTDGSYQVLPLDSRLCHFDRSSIRHTPTQGFTLKAKLNRELMISSEVVFCKVVDLFQKQEPIDALDREVHNYATLKHLQGVVIPQVRGYYDVWGLSAGYVHGDIARRNFCTKGNMVFLVDLETLALGTHVERENELAAIDAL